VKPASLRPRHNRAEGKKSSFASRPHRTSLSYALPCSHRLSPIRSSNSTCPIRKLVHGSTGVTAFKALGTIVPGTNRSWGWHNFSLQKVIALPSGTYALLIEVQRHYTALSSLAIRHSLPRRVYVVPVLIGVFTELKLKLTDAW